MKRDPKALPPSRYKTYMKSPEWRAVRLRYYRSKLPQCCRVCGDRRFDLHHRTYVRLGCEHLRDLVPLCRAHHMELHAQERAARRKPKPKKKKATSRFS